MVGKNRGYPKTYGNRWSRYKPTVQKAITIASNAYKVASMVAGVVNAEKKFYDDTFTYFPDVNGQVFQITDIPQGDTNTTRDGNSVAIKSLEYTINLVWDIANCPKENVRVIVFRDNNDNKGVPPTTTDFLESSNTIAFRNKSQAERFTTLMDKVYCCDTSKPQIFLNKFKKFFNKKDYNGNRTRQHHITFNGPDGDDSAKGHLYMLVVGNYATGTTASVCYVATRMRFYDN